MVMPVEVALLAGQTDPTDSLVTGVASVEEAVTVAEEVAQATKRRTLLHTMNPLPIPMIKALCKATTTDIVVHHLKTLTIRITPLLVLILPFQNSPVPIRITHPMKVRSEAIIEVFVSSTGSHFAVSTQRHILQGAACFPFSIKSTDAQRISYEIQLRKHLSSLLSFA